MSRSYQDFIDGVNDRNLEIKMSDLEGEVDVEIKQFRPVPPELAEEWIKELKALIEVLEKDSFQEVEGLEQ